MIYSKILVGQSRRLHDGGLGARPKVFVPVNRYGNDRRFTWLLVNVVTALDACQSPALSLQDLAHLLTGNGLHTSTSASSAPCSRASPSAATSSQPSMASRR